MTQAYPLAWPEGWPRTPTGHRRSKYALRCTFDVAREKLYRELRLLEASSCVISCNLLTGRNGAHLTGNADTAIQDPGVAIYFSLDGRQMVMASDVYETPAANLRSVGLAVEHLRGLERHGGGYMMQRAFGGFTALPPPSGGAQAEAVDWRKELGPLPDGLEKSDMLILAESRYRAKSRDAHTDTGGSNERMIRLNAAVAAARAALA